MRGSGWIEYLGWVDRIEDVTVDLGLVNKVVLITGASGGLGAGMAIAFAQEGARVAVHYRSRKQGAEQVRKRICDAGGEAETFHADLRNEMEIHALIDAVVARYGRIDCLINNAGVVLKAYAEDTDAEHWDDTLNINLRAPHLLSRAALPHIPNGGCVIHNSSIHAKNTVQNFAAYAASKAGLEALAKAQALEWADRGIRVNCIAPGVVPVERTFEVLESVKQEWLPHIPQGRYGLPEDIAGMTLYLASNLASWITGQSFVVDGGMTARMNMPRRGRLVPPDAVSEVG